MAAPAMPINRAASVALALGLVVSYAGVYVSAGHGAAPVGYLLTTIVDPANDWFGAAAAGWAGIVLVLASALPRHREAYLLCLPPGGLILAVSLARFAQESDLPSTAVCTAVPFAALQALALARCVALLRTPYDGPPIG
jgi:hypothetical protein